MVYLLKMVDLSMANWQCHNQMVHHFLPGHQVQPFFPREHFFMTRRKEWNPLSFFVQLRKDTHAKKSIAIIEVVTCKVPQITLPANSQGVGKQRSLLHGMGDGWDGLCQ